MNIRNYWLTLGACVLLSLPLSTGTAFAQSSFRDSPHNNRAVGLHMKERAIIPLAARKNATAIRVPECRFAGESTSVDLSTTGLSHWSVTGPAQSGMGGPTHATLTAWTAISRNWIQPFRGPSSDQYGTANASAKSGIYTYTLHFNLPCDPKGYQALEIKGMMAADNSFTAYLNQNNGAHQVANCPPQTCFKSPGTPVSYSSASHPGVFQQGDNTLIVVVNNNGTYTGMAAKLTLHIKCGKMCCKELPSRR